MGKVNRLQFWTFTILLNLILAQSALSQSSQSWIRFKDTKTGLYGYKDLNGVIKVPAKFEILPPSNTFDIIAVSEEIDSSYISYYLLKNGQKVAVDSVYIFDFTFDCESEGKIRFVDRAGKVGFLNKDGKVIIPAIYNYATPFYNGVSVTLKNAKRKCWGKDDSVNCEHYSYVGGERNLINDKNEILVANFQIDSGSLNWYSMLINPPSIDTSICISVKDVNNNIYSFVDYEKEFSRWLYAKFLPGLDNKIVLRNLVFQEVTFWSQKNQKWISVDKEKFMSIYKPSTLKKCFEMNYLKELNVFQDDLNWYMYTKPIYTKFYNTCGYPNSKKYPLFNTVISYYKKRDKSLSDTSITEKIAKPKSKFFLDYELDYQQDLLFIRTEKGYKLLEVSLEKN
jgi:WG containing repeat